MKKILLIICSSVFLLSSCLKEGEIEKINGLENTDYIIEKVNISKFDYVYVAKHKQCPEVLTSTEIYSDKNSKRYYGYITDNSFVTEHGQTYKVLSETDSIIVLQK